MNFENLNNENYLLYAIKNYDNPQCISEEDFFNDFKRISYIKRIMKHYEETGEIESKIILTLNHIISFRNVFGGEPTLRLLFLLINENYYKYLKPFLVYLLMEPKIVYGINGKNIYFSDIYMDDKIIEELRKKK